MKLKTFTTEELTSALTYQSRWQAGYECGVSVNLGNASFTNVDFSNINLSHVCFGGANLTNANFSNANLTGANFTNANLTGACLIGANLKHAEFDGAIGHAKITDRAINDLLKIARTILSDISKLKMNDVHFCDTVHCAAGWTCKLIPIAQNLEKIIGWNDAACMAIPIPEFTSLFYSDDATMLAFLESVVADNGKALQVKYLSENKEE
jgi:Pentapeptide repeats (8 copies)